jgi:hypothetical protein
MKHLLFWPNSKCSIWALTTVVAVGIATTSLLRADDAAPGATARLSSTDGSVQIVQSGQIVADPAPLNAPLFETAQLVTAQDGKAEVQFQDGSVVRLSPNSALTLLSLTGQAGAEVSFDGGLAYFEVPDGGNRQMRIRFGDSVLTASAGSIIRIRLDTPPGEVAVFSGFAHLERGSALALDLQSGQTVKLDPSNQGRYGLDTKIDPDSWDAWNQDRDQALNAMAANQTNAAADIAGDNANTPAWSDLDANGSWYDVPGQGRIWSPTVASSGNWDPYGCGHWMWTPHWGYVWVSCESWGFMPYMCGAWSYYDSFGWGWSPSMGMGCHGGMWGAGYFGGIHIANAPGWYRPVDRPGPKRPIGRIPTPILVDRRGTSSGTGGSLPPRNGLANIGGQPVRPIARSGFQPGNQRLQQGFGNRTSPTDPGGMQRTPGMTYGTQQNPGSNGMNVRPGYNVHASQPEQITPSNGFPPQHGFQPPQQQPQPGFQPPQQQHGFQPQQQQHQQFNQPQQQHYSQPAPSHSSPPPSFSGGGNAGGGSHSSGSGNNSHK